MTPSKREDTTGGFLWLIQGVDARKTFTECPLSRFRELCSKLMRDTEVETPNPPLWVKAIPLNSEKAAENEKRGV